MVQAVVGIIDMLRQGIPCMFYVFTGVYCPGCGGTRAVMYLLRGEPGKSFQYHPLVLFLAVVTAAEIISWVVSKVYKNPKLYLQRYVLLTYVGVGIILCNWIWKNYMLVVKGIDLLP